MAAVLEIGQSRLTRAKTGVFAQMCELVGLHTVAGCALLSLSTGRLVSPGRVPQFCQDFIGRAANAGEEYARISFATSTGELEEALEIKGEAYNALQ